MVLNIHYYDNGGLEPRIFESLALGVPVLSEAAPIDDFPELATCSSVRFFTENTLISSIENFLAKVPKPVDVRDCLGKGMARFHFAFERFLLNEFFVDIDRLTSLPPLTLGNYSKVVLTIPEKSRKASFYEDSHNIFKWQEYDGYLSKISWYGCAISYSRLAALAVQQNVHNLIVAEDDVKFPKNLKTLEIITEYLNTHLSEWDVFCGLIADVAQDTVVLNVTEYRGLQFVTLDRMTSTVFNVYGRRALAELAAYRTNVAIHANIQLTPEVIEYNTIDRYLNRDKTLRIVTVSPYVFGHRENVISTIWRDGAAASMNGDRYTNVIINSQIILHGKVLKYLHSRDLE